MFKIGEFSKLTQVSTRMLRHYDEVGLLTPTTVDSTTGYRYYSIEQVPTLQRIRMLRELDFSVVQINDILHNWNDTNLIDILEKQMESTQLLITAQQNKLAEIQRVIKHVQEKQIDFHYNIMIKSIPSYTILSLRKTIPNYYCEGQLWQELMTFIKKEHIPIHQKNHAITIFHDENYKDEDVNVEVAIIVNEFIQNKEGFTYRKLEAVETMVSMMVYGSYDNINLAYQSLIYWLNENKQYTLDGLSRQICHRGAHNEKDPNKYLTEIQNPVRRIKND